jgi:hypothetical protein
MKSKITTITSILLTASMFSACSDSESGYGSDDNSAALYLLAAVAAAPTDLPQPTLDTANMILDGATQVFTHKLACSDGDIGLMASIGNPPILNLHNFSFAATSLNFGAGAAAIVLDVTGGSYGVASTCTGKIMENSATVYDLQVKDCALTTTGGAPNPPTTTVSFRVRCTKG